MSPANRRFLTVVLCLFPATAFAQSSITTGSPTAVPVGGPWLVPGLAFILMAGAAWMIRSRGLRPGVASVALVLATAVGAAGVLHALTIEFTNPDGETILVPLEAETGEGFIVEWEPADFTNNSGQPLQIVSFVAPEFTECAPEGGFEELADASPEPSPYPICEVNHVLGAGETCRVDVDALCREAALTGMATVTSVDPASGGVPGGDVVVIHGTNLSTASYVEFGGTPATIIEATDTTVTVTTPGKAAGTYYVFVVTDVGAPTLANAFTYVAGL